MAAEHRLRIGIDYGGVCSVKAEDYENDNKEFLEGNRTLSMPGCEEALRTLAEKHDLYLISFCGARRAKETKAFLEKTYPGLFKELYFVKDRHHKNAICKLIGTDVMIDDRADVLATITKTHCIHFAGDPAFHDAMLDNAPRAYSWEETVKMINGLHALNNVPEPDALKKYKAKIY
jgi:hypothetical protein